MSEKAPTSLHIGMIAPGYPSGRRGDYRGVFVQNLVRHLKQRGHRVTVLTSAIFPDDPFFQQLDEEEAVHRFRFWSEGKLLAQYDRVPVLRMITYMIAGYRRALRVFGGSDCDLIHTHFILPTGVIGAGVARRLGRPHILTAHGSDVRMATHRRPLSPVLAPLARYALRGSQQITATAHHIRQGCLWLGTPPERLHLQTMAIDDLFFEEPGAAEDIPVGDIISTRSLMERPYNVSLLLRALPRVARQWPGLRVTIAGDGPDRPQLEALARASGLGDVVRFTGWLEASRMARTLGRHRIYVSTSLADGASVSLFEAMARWAFPVVSDIAANRQWIRHGVNGLLFSPTTPDDLADRLLEALHARVPLDAAIERNRRLARETFSWAGTARNFETFYRKLLEQVVRC